MCNWGANDAVAVADVKRIRDDGVKDCEWRGLRNSFWSFCFRTALIDWFSLARGRLMI